MIKKLMTAFLIPLLCQVCFAERKCLGTTRGGQEAPVQASRMSILTLGFQNWRQGLRIRIQTRAKHKKREALDRAIEFLEWKKKSLSQRTPANKRTLDEIDGAIQVAFERLEFDEMLADVSAMLNSHLHKLNSPQFVHYSVRLLKGVDGSGVNSSHSHIIALLTLIRGASQSKYLYESQVAEIRSAAQERLDRSVWLENQANEMREILRQPFGTLERVADIDAEIARIRHERDSI
jgi:hypothetical protein